MGLLAKNENEVIGRIAQWIIGGLVTIVLSLIGAWAMDTHATVVELQAKYVSSQVNEAAMRQELKDIRQELVEIKTIIKKW